MMRKILVIFAFLLGCSLVCHVQGHGRLIEPPSRASMWRYGFDTPHDYNDHESYCGGFTRQWQRNSGKCGICGDPWDAKLPRAHEAGGKYGKGIIVRKYPTASEIPIKIELTANHRGYFEFRVCPMTIAGKEVSQECLDKYILKMANGTSKYYPGPGNRVFESSYMLPDGLQCAQCVLQWKYTAGNNWGDCGNGSSAVGCGPQEEFRGCADVTIGDNVPPLPSPPPKRKPTPSGTQLPGRGTVSEDDEWTTVSTELPETSEFIWYFSFIIAGACLLVVVAALALLYGYYYHAERAKQWLMARRRGEQQIPAPVAPPRQKRLSASNLYL